MTRYDLLGEIVETEELLRGAPAAGPDDPTTLRFEISEDQPPPAPEEFAAARTLADGSRPIWRYAAGDGFRRMSMPGGSDYDISEDWSTVTGRPTHSTREGCVQEFLGPGLAVVISLQGRIVLHCSAVITEDGRVLLFCGHSGYGKSTMARGLVERGAALFADDMVLIDQRADGPWACAGSRAQKLDPDSPVATVADDGPVALSPRKRWIDHAGGGPTRLPVAAIFAIARGTEPAGAERLRGIEAFKHVIPFHAIVGLLNTTTIGPDLMRRHHSALGELASTVPIHVLSYPDGPAGLDLAAAAIADALSASSAG